MLKKSQKIALDLMLSGRNVFLSGEAGTGKSYVLRYFLDSVTKSKVLVCAPTGIAAINVCGATIHRTFKAPIGPIVKDPVGVPDVVLEADIIIIDEISMCRCDLFDYVAKTIVDAEERTGKKKQLVVVGDFYQLPPVVTDQDREVLEIAEGFAFQAKLWDYFNFEKVVLTEVVRQGDDVDFVTNLNAIRKGDSSCIAWVNENAAKKENKGIHLCSTNKTAADINNQAMRKLKGRVKKYVAIESGEVTENDRATAQELSLKPGTRVMMLVNDKEDKYQNGSLGTISELDRDSLVVDLDNGASVIVERHKWEIMKYEVKTFPSGEKKVEQTVIGTFIQFPIKVAYAITIHKSQGQTYDSANLHPNCFAAGQLYVALSRVKSIKGLHLVNPIKDDYLITSQAVLNFYEDVRVQPVAAGHGGKREGAGRKQKYNCETTVMRVPAHMKAEIEKFIAENLKM